MNKVSRARILVCGFDRRFIPLAESDAKVYSRYFTSVEIVFFESIACFLARLKGQYLIIHLFCLLTKSGDIVDMNGATLNGTRFVEECNNNDVSLIWVASSNTSDCYVRGFRLSGRRINVVMTLDRRDRKLSEFLERILCKSSEGKTVSASWAAVAPQGQGPWQEESPECIFFAGKPSAVLSL
jgi:hypothetical protein